MKDSASIFQDSDAVILLHRAYIDNSGLGEFMDDEEEKAVSEGAMDDFTEVTVTARRHKGGNTALHFYDDRILFTDKGSGYINMLRERRQKLKKKKR